MMAFAVPVCNSLITNALQNASQKAVNRRAKDGKPEGERPSFSVRKAVNRKTNGCRGKMNGWQEKNESGQTGLRFAHFI